MTLRLPASVKMPEMVARATAPTPVAWPCHVSEGVAWRLGLPAGSQRYWVSLVPQAGAAQQLLLRGNAGSYAIPSGVESGHRLQPGWWGLILCQRRCSLRV